MKETEMQGRARKALGPIALNDVALANWAAEFAREELLSAARDMRESEGEISDGGKVKNWRFVAEWLERRAKQ